MASPLHKKSLCCTSPGRQDTRQEQKVNAKSFFPGSLMNFFGPKEVKASAEDTTSCFCMKDVAGTNGVIPWMDKLWKTLSRSLFNKASSKRRSVNKALTMDTILGENVLFGRRASPKGAPENNLHMQDDTISHHLNKHTTNMSGAVESEDFPVGIFLYQPVENQNGQKASVKKASLQKQSSLGFARVQGEPSLILSEQSIDDELPRGVEAVHSVESLRGSPLWLQGMQLDSFLHSIPGQHPSVIPDKERLSSVQDFFLYAEAEGKRLFEELDKDKDGRVSADDLTAMMHELKLPSSYSKKFMHRKYNRWPAKFIGWTDFSWQMQEKEPTMIRLFNSLDVSKHGTLQRPHLKKLLKEKRVSDSDSNITAMIKALGGEGDSIKYGQFRRFMLLVPTEQLRSDPWSVWFRAANLGAESEVAKGSALNHCTLLSSGFSKIVSPDLPRVEEVSEFIKSTVKHVIREPLTRVRVDALKIGG